MSDDPNRTPDQPSSHPAPPPLPAQPAEHAAVQPVQPVVPPAHPVEYGQPAYPPQQYGTPQYGAQAGAYGAHFQGSSAPVPQFNIIQQNVAPVSEPRGLSVASFVLALLSILLGFTFIVPVISLILGIVGARKEPAGRGLAITGIVLSSLILLTWVFIFLFAFGLLATVLSTPTLVN